jgi:hypothetical protein
MPLLIGFLLRLVFVVAAGFVLAALACVLAVTLALWALRAAWALLTGRPVTPFAMRIVPQHLFEEMVRRAPRESASRTPRADAAAAAGARGRLADVTDVQPK